jgi:hypothetical protein
MELVKGNSKPLNYNYISSFYFILSYVLFLLILLFVLFLFLRKKHCSDSFIGLFFFLKAKHTQLYYMLHYLKLVDRNTQEICFGISTDHGCASVDK